MIEANELVTVILVTYYSNKNLRKILKQIPNKYKIIVTENSLDTNLKSEIENDYKNIEILIPSTNLGNGGGVNYALKKVRTKYALYLDIDIELTDDLIDELIKIAENQKDWAILAPNLKNYDYKSNNFIKRDLENNLSRMRFVEGCALFLNFEKLKKYGFYDDKIFLYYEEDDLFFKYLKNNLNIILCENVYLKHQGNSSTDKEFKLEIELNRNWHYMWSKFYFYRKHHNYLIALYEIKFHLISAILKIIFYTIAPNRHKKRIYFARFSGLINSMIFKKSWHRPKV